MKRFEDILEKKWGESITTEYLACKNSYTLFVARSPFIINPFVKDYTKQGVTDKIV